MSTIDLSTPASAGLRRELGLASATAVVAGECIAVGIFLTPAGMAKALGSPLGLLLVWLAVGAMTLSGALCYGELASRFPRAGGGYVYLEEAFGKRTAFLYGWMCLLIMDPGLTASLATGTAGYAAYIFHWSPLIVKVAAIFFIGALCLLNILSTRLSAGFMRWITWRKLGVVGFLTIWAIVLHLGSWSNFVPFVAQRAGSMPLGAALGVATVGAFYSFGGWWEVSKIAGEMRDPGRTLQRALILGIRHLRASRLLRDGEGRCLLTCGGAGASAVRHAGRCNCHSGIDWNCAGCRQQLSADHCLLHFCGGGLPGTDGCGIVRFSKAEVACCIGNLDARITVHTGRIPGAGHSAAGHSRVAPCPRDSGGDRCRIGGSASLRTVPTQKDGRQRQRTRRRWIACRRGVANRVGRSLAIQPIHQPSLPGRRPDPDLLRDIVKHGGGGFLEVTFRRACAIRAEN